MKRKILRTGSKSRFGEPDMRYFLVSEAKRIKTYDERGSAENAVEIAAKGRDFDQVLRTGSKSRSNLNNLKPRAMSLLEVSIIITVIGVFISGSLAIATFSLGIKNKETTNSNIEEIYGAIGRFIANNGRLPCPAPLNLDRDSDSQYGIESRSITGCQAVSGGVFNSGQIFYGAVPTGSLGIPSTLAEDGYQNKISYIVDSRLANKTSEPIDFVNKPSFGALDIASQASIIWVKKRDYSGNLSDDAPNSSKAIFAIISHGQNGLGSFPATSKIANLNPSNADEQDNYFGNPAGTFNSQIISAAENSDQFDDIVFYKTRESIVFDFSLDSLIACNGNLITDINYPKISVFFNEQVNSINFCPNYQKTYIRCRAGGVWDLATSC